jgi:hypothetical protein
MAAICFIIADAGFAYFIMGGMDEIVGVEPALPR